MAGHIVLTGESLKHTHSFLYKHTGEFPLCLLLLLNVIPCFHASSAYCMGYTHRRYMLHWAQPHVQQL